LIDFGIAQQAFIFPILYEFFHSSDLGFIRGRLTSFRHRHDFHGVPIIIANAPDHGHAFPAFGQAELLRAYGIIHMKSLQLPQTGQRPDIRHGST